MIEKIIKTRELTTKMSKEDLDNGYEHYLTVGDLKKFLEQHDLPNDAKVLVERVEDAYYEDNNWRVYEKDTDQEGKAQYTPAWCVVRCKDDKDLLFIDLHY